MQRTTTLNNRWQIFCRILSISSLLGFTGSLPFFGLLPSPFSSVLPSGASRSSPSPSTAFVFSPSLELISGCLSISALISMSSSNEISIGIAVASSATLLLFEYSLTACSISVGVYLMDFMVVNITTGETSSSRLIRSPSLSFPFFSTLALYICDFCSCITNKRWGSKSIQQSLRFHIIFYLITFLVFVGSYILIWSLKIGLVRTLVVMPVSLRYSIVSHCSTVLPVSIRFTVSVMVFLSSDSHCLIFSLTASVFLYVRSSSTPAILIIS